jgi:hypothetical protein
MHFMIKRLLVVLAFFAIAISAQASVVYELDMDFHWPPEVAGEHLSITFEADNFIPLTNKYFYSRDEMPSCVFAIATATCQSVAFISNAAQWWYPMPIGAEAVHFAADQIFPWGVGGWAVPIYFAAGSFMTPGTHYSLEINNANVEAILTVQSVPEPGQIALILIGLLAIGFHTKRRDYRSR